MRLRREMCQQGSPEGRSRTGPRTGWCLGRNGTAAALRATGEVASAIFGAAEADELMSGVAGLGAPLAAVGLAGAAGSMPR